MKLEELIEEIRLLLDDPYNLEEVIGTSQRIGYEDAIQNVIKLIESLLDKEKYYSKG